LDVYVGLRIRDVIDCEDSSSSLVVDLAEGAVAFLPGCVPQRGLHLLPVQGERLGVELDPYGGLHVLIEFAPDVLGGDVGLAGAGIAYEDYLVELRLVIHSYYYF
jgi:hypothetical protein